MSSTAGTGGSGTIGAPWKLGDLYNPATLAPGVALTTLVAGDTLYFRGGTYALTDTASSHVNHAPYICPANSGTALAPITLRSYPGEVAYLLATDYPAATSLSPVIGTMDRSSVYKDYIKILGFKIQPGLLGSGATLFGPSGIDINGGLGNEAGYCEVVGRTITGVDNYCGVWIGPDAQNANVHHNEIHGFKDSIQHSQGIIDWSVWPVTIADNNLHDNGAAYIDKLFPGPDLQHTLIYARNWEHANDGASQGNLEGNKVTYQIYDNVFQNAIWIGWKNVGTSIYNNLELSPQAGGAGGFGLDLGNGNIAGNTADYCVQTNAWNNVFASTTAGFSGVLTGYQNYVASGAGASFSYLDYNFYCGVTGTLDYEFEDQTRTQAQMITDGFEAHSAKLASLSVIYPNYGTGDWTLAVAYTTAGRYGDAVGPRVAISGTGGIMDPTRYGPGALT